MNILEKGSRFILLEEQRLKGLSKVHVIVDTLTGIEYFYSVGRSGPDNFVPILNEAGLPRINPEYDPDNKDRKEDL